MYDMTFYVAPWDTWDGSFVFRLQGEVIIEHIEWEASCVYIFNMQEAIIMKHTNTKWHLCTHLVNL